MENSSILVREIRQAGLYPVGKDGVFLPRGLSFVICQWGSIQLRFDDGGSQVLCSGEIIIVIGYKKLLEIVVKEDTGVTIVHLDTVILLNALCRGGNGSIITGNHMCLKQALYKTIPVPNVDEIVSLLRILNDHSAGSCFDAGLIALIEAFILFIEEAINKSCDSSIEEGGDIPLRYAMLVQNDILRTGSVQKYAKELGLPVSRLNSLLRRQTGFTAGRIAGLINAQRIRSMRLAGYPDDAIMRAMGFSSIYNLKRFLQNNDYPHERV